VGRTLGVRLVKAVVAKRISSIKGSETTWHEAIQK
jgi:hypothetical protein